MATLAPWTFTLRQSPSVSQRLWVKASERCRCLGMATLAPWTFTLCRSKVVGEGI